MEFEERGWKWEKGGKLRVKFLMGESLKKGSLWKILLWGCWWCGVLERHLFETLTDLIELINKPMVT